VAVSEVEWEKQRKKKPCVFLEMHHTVNMSVTEGTLGSIDRKHLVVDSETIFLCIGIFRVEEGDD